MSIEVIFGGHDDLFRVVHGENVVGGLGVVVVQRLLEQPTRMVTMFRWARFPNGSRRAGHRVATWAASSLRSELPARWVRVVIQLRRIASDLRDRRSLDTSSVAWAFAIGKVEDRITVE